MVRDQRRDEEFSLFVASRWRTLVRSALALGCNPSDAEDLAQVTAVRCYVSWTKVAAAEHQDAYVSKILLNCFRDSHRRGWRRETVVDEVPEMPSSDPTDVVVVQDAINRALTGLSRGQREVVALRFFLRLTEAQIAETLQVAPGTVKSRLSRALAQLALSNELADLDGGRG